MVDKYEKSGEGAISRLHEGSDWGKFDIALYRNDIRSWFLLNSSSSYLLYWWQKLDEYNLLSFSTADTDMFPDRSVTPNSKRDRRGKMSIKRPFKEENTQERAKLEVDHLVVLKAIEEKRASFLENMRSNFEKLQLNYQKLHSEHVDTTRKAIDSMSIKYCK